ncbi:hypothetical protein KFK09_008075 [Dendrobium nobile]|uniref:Uncharacterized protein n=1 Tax=Dendrobium nobile TaxID=94219 RepID=A0A8T3BW28_DENNO|nr:hypothetical protein KFK09_008075 [Dendrobium nobile]
MPTPLFVFDFLSLLSPLFVLCIWCYMLAKQGEPKERVAQQVTKGTFWKAMCKEHLELELGQWDPSISRPYSSSRGATGGTTGS